MSAVATIKKLRQSMEGKMRENRARIVKQEVELTAKRAVKGIMEQAIYLGVPSRPKRSN